MTHTKTRDRLARILTLVPYLIANPGISREEACSAFDIDGKTLNADLDLLWVCGVPPYDPYALIDVERDDGGVTVSSADYFARPVSLTAGEARALLSSLEILGGLGGEGDALHRLVGKVRDTLGDVGVEQPIEFAPAAGASRSVFAVIRRGVDERRRVRISYFTASRDTAGQRTIDPHRLVNAGGQWYVSAFCHQARAMRLFRLDRVETAAATEERFERESDSIEEAYDHGLLYEPSPDDEVAAVLFSPRAAPWAIETWHSCDHTQDADGSATIHIPYARTRWMIKQILPFGAEAAILGPKKLVDEFTEYATSLAEVYRDASRTN